MSEMTTDLPPAPDGPTEKDRAAAALRHAKRAVEFTEQLSPMWRSAEQEFFRSWLGVMQGAFDDAEESEHRRLAWERAEEAEGALEVAESKLRAIAATLMVGASSQADLADAIRAVLAK